MDNDQTIEGDNIFSINMETYFLIDKKINYMSKKLHGIEMK